MKYVRPGAPATTANAPAIATAAVTATATATAIAMGLAVSTDASASDEADLLAAYGDKATISLATGGPRSLRRAPAVGTVITAEDIAAMGATELEHVLEAVPGLHVNVAPSMRNTLYVIRGVFSSQTPQVLVLQNGIPITVQLTGGRGNLSGGPALENIARIEIIRGPGSALHGSDAFSGIINFITRGAADRPGTRVGLRVGSFQSADAWLQHAGRLGGLDYAIFAKAATTDGFSRTIESDAQSRNDRTFGTRVSLAPGPVNLSEKTIDGGFELASDAWRWRTLYKLRDDLGTYAGLGSALDPVGRGSSERTLSDLSWTSPAGASGWGLAANLSWMQYLQRFPVPPRIFPPGTRLPTGTFVNGMFGAPEVSERSLRLSAQATYSGWADHTVLVGAGHDDLDMYMAREFTNFTYTRTGVPVPAEPLRESTLPFIYPQRRKVDYAFVQDEWQLHPDWRLTAGVRHDRYSDAGGTTNPRAALVWEAAVDWTVKLLYGQAFRAPSFSQLYSTNNPIARGDPRLKPETTRTLEAVLNWDAAPNLQWNWNVYAYRMKDVLRTVANPPPVPGSTHANLGRQEGRGVEAEVVWDLTRQFRLAAHASRARTVDPATGLAVADVPRRERFVRADWRADSGWRLNAIVNRVAGRSRASTDTRPPIADYTTVDFALTHDAGLRGWTCSAVLRNAFNEDVREPSLAPGLVANDLPQARRSFSLQLGYRLP